jgi:N-acetylglucosamine-6-sulfatase
MRYLLALALLLASTAASFAAPNIVVVMTDDQATGSLRYMPKLQKLIAEQGITFDNSFVNLSLCAPSRVSFMTGEAAHNHGIKANSPLDKGGWESFKDREPDALPVWLQRAGYDTALVGKYLNRYGQQDTFGALLGWAGNTFGIDVKGPKVGNPRDWVPPGWDLWYAFTGSRVRYFDYEINENGAILDFGSSPGDYSTDVLAGRAVRFIEDQQGTAKPFFMYVATKAAHAQGARAIPAPKYETAFADVPLPENSAFNERSLARKRLKAPHLKQKRKDELTLAYRAALRSLQSVDDLVADIVGALERTGQLDHTVIIYTSDNGFLFGEHRLIGKSAAYEESIKVPLLMRGPGIPAGETRAQLVSNLDVVATIVDLAHAHPGVPLDGRSLVPLFGSAEVPWRGALLFESPVNRFEPARNRYTGVRTPTRKYVKYDGGFEELFDLAADPHELSNEAANPVYAGDLATLRALEEKLKSCAGDGCWAEARTPRPSDAGEEKASASPASFRGDDPGPMTHVDLCPEKD